MKNVIFISEEKSTKEKNVELTHRKKSNGWKILMDRGTSYLSQSTKVVYLGKCNEDGDMFAVYHDGFIKIFRGHLNNGKY